MSLSESDSSNDSGLSEERDYLLWKPDFKILVFNPFANTKQKS